MKKYLHILLLTTIVILCLPTLVMASDISDAKFTGIIRVSNNSTAANDVSANFSLDTQALIDGGYITANCSDIAIHDPTGTDATFMPSVNSTVPWFVFTDNISAYGSLDYNLYCGGVTGGNIAYFPGTGGMTVSDNANIEPGDNFTITYRGYIDTTTAENITEKGSALRLYSNGTGDITASIDYAEIDGAHSVCSELYTGTVNRSAQRIDACPVLTFTSVSFYLAKLGAPAGTGYVRVRKVSDDSIIGTLGTIDVSTLAFGGGWHTFSNNVNKTSIQDIRISFEYDGGSGTDHVRVYGVGSDQGYGYR